MITIFGLYRAKDHDKGKQAKKSLHHQVSKCFHVKELNSFYSINPTSQGLSNAS